MTPLLDPRCYLVLLPLIDTCRLRELIADERASGDAFGWLAEAARHELARRGEQA